jgi:hypothetical protein
MVESQAGTQTACDERVNSSIPLSTLEKPCKALKCSMFRAQSKVQSLEAKELVWR